ncbi:MAG: hypothetical protein A2636_00385 [Elusimicrobia bacterium RIFCSPHIGHO2_01_FULL_64_10]|nr:MAG: hypothetical protein A2636_00385 [Elusimicrobia bacterium RIFCSPHIGHO2_01_FULL_64_10]
MKLRDDVRPFRWRKRGKKTLDILDQILLPGREKWIACSRHVQVARCIKDMNVRGAPAIGCVAAYGLALAAFERSFSGPRALRTHLDSAARTLAATRPTAVNLFWALERMLGAARKILSGRDAGPRAVERVREALETEADRIFAEDLAANHRMGELGASLLKKDSVVLTHCNAGSLATSGWGTALGVIRAAYQKGKVRKVLVDETRPYLQGARLTAWELHRDGIPCELITDNMAAHFMKTERVDAVIVGSDRISRNGDVANKIGTYGLAVQCRHHGIPFFVAAPVSTIDLDISDGGRIPIEERSAREVTHIQGFAIAPAGVKARHPAFDVTPHELVGAIITEKGIARPPNSKTVPALLNGEARVPSRSLSI